MRALVVVVKGKVLSEALFGTAVYKLETPTVETDLMELDLYFVGTRWGKVFFLDSKGSLRHY